MKVKSMVFGLMSFWCASACVALEPIGNENSNPLQVKEVTVFKDGHAFVLREGTMPVSEAGTVVMDDLPLPVIGTFWPYSKEADAPLQSVTAGTETTWIKRPAVTLYEMIETAVGEKVGIKEHGGQPIYEAVVVGIPKPEDTSGAQHAGTIVLLRVDSGIKTVSLDRIQEIIFRRDGERQVEVRQLQDRMTLALDWQGKPRAQAEVGMVYLQKGLRWIPSYHVDISEEGVARIKLQATLINELMDLRGVTANLAIGVPSFAFENTPDPISLQQVVAQLSSQFQPSSHTGYAFSNAIMSQSIQFSPVQSAQPSVSGSGVMDLGPNIGGSARQEDLYVFTLKNINLRKGERMVLPVAEYELPYLPVYSLSVPFSPPTELWENLYRNHSNGMNKLYHAPKVKHNIRLQNNSTYPLTTAPVVLMKNGVLLAQGMMTYTPVGGRTDIELTTAVDISVEKKEQETKRVGNAYNWSGHSFARIDLQGELILANHKDHPVVVEVSRDIFGCPDTSANGEHMRVSTPEELSMWPEPSGQRWWWGYGWPWWWAGVNGCGRFSWTTTIQPNESKTLQYTWHYYWR